MRVFSAENRLLRIFRPSRSTTKVVTSPFTIIRIGLQRSGVVVQRYQAQNRNIETEAQPEKRAILPERHQLLPSEPGKRMVVLHESCVIVSRLERSRAERRNPNI